MMPSDRFTLTRGTPKEVNSSGDSFRYFCGDCGTGLYYINETFLPGIIDVQAMTLDTPDDFPPDAQVQTNEQAGWVPHLASIAAFRRYPGMD